MHIYYRIVYLSFFVVISLLNSGCQPAHDVPMAKWQHAVEGAYAANISNDAKYSVVSSIHHGVSLWDIDENALLYNWSQQQDNVDNLVLAVDISDNNSHVLTANRTNFSLWNMTTGESEGYWQVRDSNIRDIALSNNGRYILIGKSNGTVVHVNMANGRRIEFLGHRKKIFNETRVSNEEPEFILDTKTINSVDMLPNGRVAISGGNDFVAYVWDTASGQVIYKFNHPSRVTKVALDPKGRFAFTADSKKAAHIWDLKTGKLLGSLKYTNRQEVFSSISFSPDGTKILTGAPSRRVSLWEINSGERLMSWHVTPREDIRPAGAVVYSVAFRDNSQILTESSSGYAELWQMPTSY